MTAITTPSSKPSKKTPKFRRHKATGQAYVELNGKRLYLGQYQLSTTRERYFRVLAEWEACGQQPRTTPGQLTVMELIGAFWEFAKRNYRKPNGEPSTELDAYRQALRPLKRFYGSVDVKDFKPRSLVTVMNEMVKLGWARTSINRHLSRLKAMFRWGVEQEYVLGEGFHALQAVRGLRRGRTEAHETAPVKPVPDELIELIKPHVATQIWAMIQIQLLTGCRPDEVVRLRALDFKDTSGEVWKVHYEQHKTAHFDIAKTIFFGPRAKSIIAPYMKDRPVTAYLFSPFEAETQRRLEQHATRKVPLSCGNVPGTNRKDRPARKPGAHYDVAAYRRAITRACDEAFPPAEYLRRIKVAGKKGQRRETAFEWKNRLGKERWAELLKWQDEHRWSPGQLRHNAATRMRDRFGIDAAQTFLGHRLGSRITEIYAEHNVQKAIEAVRAVG